MGDLVDSTDPVIEIYVGDGGVSAFRYAFLNGSSEATRNPRIGGSDRLMDIPPGGTDHRRETERASGATLPEAISYTPRFMLKCSIACPQRQIRLGPCSRLEH